MLAIDKAWEDNLQEPKDDQWKSKEDLIDNCCPYGEYNLKIKGFKDDGDLCEEYNENCTKCWNSEIEEDVEEEDNKSELTFDKIKESPINEMYFSDMTENNFIKSLKNDEYIINCEDGTLTYDDIPKTIKWLQDVYDYCTELKNKVEYVNFNIAKEHMKNGNKAKFKDCTYWIENEELCFDLYSESRTTNLSLSMIDSKEWILL